jgi:serralysin
MRGPARTRGDENDTLDGGSGDDRVAGGLGNDKLSGSSGNDFLLGEEGNDRLAGGANRDILFGGLGVDTLLGDGGDDLLVADRTSADGDAVAAAAIFAEWTSGNSYNDRVSNIRAQAITILDDGNVDTLFGHGNLDWFLFGSGDKVKDKATGEFLN